ncbi:putative efflux pump antibiotic resistance protein [Diaporthe sp. PMI_573]|nr:putative efflux pump antibiotic resistance protein [Diaporthaceae sp. PMI_573]
MTKSQEEIRSDGQAPTPPRPCDSEDTGSPEFKTDQRFWFIISALAMATFCSTLGSTIMPIALPTIVADLGGGTMYLWVANAFLLASLATLPLYAQIADIFGRRWPLLTALALFMLGSALGGGSSSSEMLIAARTVQGVGGAGINLLIEVVVTDLVPLRHRAKYLAAVMAAGSVAAAIGPFIGVIASHLSWRWVIAFALLFAFLRVGFRRGQSWKARLKRIDYGGSFIFIVAMCAILIALTWGGPVYRWDTFHIIVPLAIGIAGLILFLAFEWNPKLAEPSVPRVLVSNRTSAAALILTMLSALTTYWTLYFLPVFFQAVKQHDAMAAGVDCLPLFAGVLPFAILGGVLISKTGRYKPLYILACIPIAISFGLFSLLDKDSGAAMWEKYVSTAAGLWSICRGFGVVWGVTIPAAVFNNACDKNSFMVSDPAVAQGLRDRRAYEMATKAFLLNIEKESVRGEMIEMFTHSLRTVWRVGIPFAGVALLICF